MKSLLFVSLMILPTFAWAYDFSALGQCLSELGSNTDGNKTNFSSIALPGMSVRGGEELVVNSHGAKQVAVVPFNNLNVHGRFKAPGDAEGVEQGFGPDDRGNFSNPTTAFEAGESGRFGPETPFKTLSLDEATKVAGASAMASANGRTNRILRDLQNLSAYVQDEARPVLNSQVLAMERDRLNGQLTALSVCDKIPNDQIRAAAALERARLQKFDEAIRGMENETKTADDCVTQKQRSNPTDGGIRDSSH